MAVDTNIIISSNVFNGFQNYAFASFSASYAGGSIGVGSFVGPIRAQTILNNSNDISIVEIQFAGIDSFTRLLQGSTTVNYPTAASATYQIECFSYYSAGSLIVDSYIINESASTVTIPAVTFICTTGLYQSPF